MYASTAPANRNVSRPSLPQGELLDLSRLSCPPRSELLLNEEKSSVEKTPEGSEANPSRWAGSNPTHKEIAKERWYTRAAWGAIGMSYATSVYLLLEGEPLHGARSAASGLLLDGVFAYFALKNSELRRFILQGDVLPDPHNSSPVVMMLSRWGAGLYLLGWGANWLGAVADFATANPDGGAVRCIMGLTQLHLAMAWIRRIRFFQSINSL